MTETAEDGRVARGLRTREAVLEALLELYREGRLTPTIQELAAKVGVTTRSIYHHFPDREALAEALAQQQRERQPDLLAARRIRGTRTERVEGIATHRAELFETVAPVRRSALAMMHATPAIQTQQTNMAAHLRRQLARTFEPELSALDPDAEGEVLELIDLHTSWDTWDRLRTWQSLSVERSRQLVIDLVTQALER
jgi:TetR/AcrR family transcriptional regulator of autoinduction and epiphytic fitness